MKVAVVASLQKVISPISAGGTEVFSHILTEGLVKKGIDVSLFATSDSNTSATLESVCSAVMTGDKKEGPIATHELYELLQARNVIQRSEEFDVIHNNYWRYYSLSSFSSFSKCPIITTVHNNFWNYPSLRESLFKTHRKGKDVVVFLSKGAQQLAGDGVDSVVINNGINIEAFPYSSTCDESFLWFSRLVPAKGIKPAIDAARQGNFPLIVAGSPPLKPDNKAYIDEHVMPYFSDTIKYVGTPDEEKRISLYQKAKALLFPVLGEEQFPLVVLEAMSCGTPVIAYNRGAISEQIIDGVTGFIVDPDGFPRPRAGSWVVKKQGIEGLVEAMQRISEIKRSACRAHVETYFSQDRMIDQYISLYKRIAV